MQLQSLIDRIKHIFHRVGPHERYSYTRVNSIRRPTSLFLYEDNNTVIPYEELWRSAIRCKLVHREQENMYMLWKLSNTQHEYEHEPEITPTIDSTYQQELKGVSLPICFPTHGEHESIHINACVWNSIDTVYIHFETDTESEARFLRMPMRLHPIFGSVCVNRFLYRRLLSIMSTLLCYLELFKDRQCTLVFAGYSVGATMAQIAAAVLGGMFPDFVVKCHAFGGMKPGNDAFARWSSKFVLESYRIVNGNDPFVLLPVDYRWCHIANVTLHFEKHLFVHVSYKEMPWYKRLFLERRIKQTLMIKLRHASDHPFDKYIDELWCYTRMAMYLYSQTEAEIPLLTPIENKNKNNNENSETISEVDEIYNS